VIRRWLCAWVLSVWFSVLGVTQDALGEASTDAGQPNQLPAPDAATAEVGDVSCQHQRYVVLGTRDGFDAALAAEVRKDLAAELGPRGFGVCAARAGAGELAAEIWLSISEPSRVAIQIDDLVTGKRVGRDVPLTPIPKGGKALAIAIAADELLRASWAELDLPRRGQEAAPAVAAGAVAGQAYGGGPEEGERLPVNARASPGSTSKPRRGGHFVLGLLPGYVRSARAWNAFGAELRGQVRPGRAGWLEAGLGGFRALDVEVAAGSVRASGISALLSAGACTPERRRLLLCGGARASLYWTRFQGLSSGATDGFQDSVPGVTLGAAGQLGLRLSRRWLALFELALGGATTAALAKQGNQTLMGLDGFVFSSALGLGFQP
jgi:hypothetical protein